MRAIRLKYEVDQVIFCEHTTRYFTMRGSRLYRDVDFSECVMLSASDQYGR